MDELIGLKFKRNVYGPSIWVDTIIKSWITYKFSVDDPQYLRPVIMITGSKGNVYRLSEIIVLNEK
jgi:hypothetical protein